MVFGGTAKNRLIYRAELLPGKLLKVSNFNCCYATKCSVAALIFLKKLYTLFYSKQFLKKAIFWLFLLVVWTSLSWKIKLSEKFVFYMKFDRFLNTLLRINIFDKMSYFKATACFYVEGVSQGESNFGANLFFTWILIDFHILNIF